MVKVIGNGSPQVRNGGAESADVAQAREKVAATLVQAQLGHSLLGEGEARELLAEVDAGRVPSDLDARLAAIDGRSAGADRHSKRWGIERTLKGIIDQAKERDDPNLFAQATDLSAEFARGPLTADLRTRIVQLTTQSVPRPDGAVIGADPARQLGASGGADARTSPLHTFLDARLGRARAGNLSSADKAELNGFLESLGDGELQSLGQNLAERLSALDSHVDENKVDKAAQRGRSDWGSWSLRSGIAAALLGALTPGAAKFWLTSSAPDVARIAAGTVAGVFGIALAGIELINFTATVGGLRDGTSTKTEAVLATLKLAATVAGFTNPLFFAARAGLELVDLVLGQQATHTEMAKGLGTRSLTGATNTGRLIDELVEKIGGQAPARA